MIFKSFKSLEKKAKIFILININPINIIENQFKVELNEPEHTRVRNFNVHIPII